MNKQQPESTVKPFPISVNVHTKEIQETTMVDNYFATTLANQSESSNRWWNKVAAAFASKDWYQNLASPVSRIIVVWPGERKEQIAKNIGDVLSWDRAQRDEFQSLMDTTEPVMSEGKYYPGQYVAHKHAQPEEVKTMLYESFQEEILSRYTPEISSQVPLQDALTIASLLEREASDFNNMREISGVIWNRLFMDMPLQLDATLQYVKGSNIYEPSWWPQISPQDKYLDSAYNTYQNADLPPAPIANPSAEAVLAALNPKVTNCLYYFHAEGGKYHCSPNYKDHVSKLRSLYGRGS